MTISFIFSSSLDLLIFSLVFIFSCPLLFCPLIFCSLLFCLLSSVLFSSVSCLLSSSLLFSSLLSSVLFCLLSSLSLAWGGLCCVCVLVCACWVCVCVCWCVCVGVCVLGVCVGVCGVVVVCCGVLWCVVVACGVVFVVVWHAENLRVCIQHVPVCAFKMSPCVPATCPHVFFMWACCRYTRGHFERTHGDVLNAHTEGRSLSSLFPPFSLSLSLSSPFSLSLPLFLSSLSSSVVLLPIPPIIRFA